MVDMGKSHQVWTGYYQEFQVSIHKSGVPSICLKILWVNNLKKKEHPHIIVVITLDGLIGDTR